MHEYLPGLGSGFGVVMAKECRVHFGDNGNVLKLVVPMLSQFSESLKAAESHILSERIVWYMNYISIKVFLKNVPGNLLVTLCIMNENCISYVLNRYNANTQCLIYFK